jgi:ABC-type Na+ efflux pump permease subunit
MGTAWAILAGTQDIRNLGDMARFGAILFQILGPLQLALVLFLSSLVAASVIAQEKDRRTLILLLMTRMTNHELVLGKLLAGLLGVLVMVAAAFPLFFAITLFGGVSPAQVVRVFLVTLFSAFAAGSLGALVAFARDKTFQTLSLTSLILLIWLGLWEAVHFGMFFSHLAGYSCEFWAQAFSPIRAIFAAARPELETGGLVDYVRVIGPFLLLSAAISAAINAWTTLRVRVWNPSREVRLGQDDDEQAVVSIWGTVNDDGAVSEAGASGDAARRNAAEQRRSGHVDARVRDVSSRSRRVWDNPVLWREICTWAYGRKVLLIRLIYLLLFVAAATALQRLLAESVRGQLGGFGHIITSAFLLISLVIINALAVTSITNERDGQALDLLLVTDLSPREFVFGKMSGILWVTKEMVALPLALMIWLWWQGAIDGEQCLFLMVGLLVMDIFVSMLGIHCGMCYANSRSAIAVSLGTVFFLFLGVVTCMAMMVSFSGSFHSQLAPFLAFIGVGSVGLFLSLGVRNPSPAMLSASLLLPWATFNAITSYLLGHTFSVFFVTCATYGFTTAALLIPAIGEFDIAMGRTKTAGDE